MYAPPTLFPFILHLSFVTIIFMYSPFLSSNNLSLFPLDSSTVCQSLRDALVPKYCVQWVRQYGGNEEEGDRALAAYAARMCVHSQLNRT
jgi:hypothetical protein